MIAFENKKVKNVPQTDKKIIEIWFRGYRVYPESSNVPDIVRKTFKSCFAMGEWWNIYSWTNDLFWANDVNEAILNFNEQYGTNIEFIDS